MLPEPSPGAPGAGPPAAPGRSKYRLRFRKDGPLRLVSHHDLMHCFERMFRRAALPVPRTQGFNPRPRMWFALSLALGLAGGREVFELELAEPLSADEVERRLRAQAPPGLDILSACTLAPKASARVRRAFYRLPCTLPLAELSQRCAAFLARPDCWIERTRPQRRRLDVRPYVDELHACPEGIDMTLWITPYGAARPEEIVTALGLGQLLIDGAVLERTDLELYDELPPEQATPPPFGMMPPGAEKEPTTGDDERPPEDAPSAPKPHALITGPLSFDS